MFFYTFYNAVYIAIKLYDALNRRIRQRYWWGGHLMHNDIAAVCLATDTEPVVCWGFCNNPAGILIVPESTQLAVQARLDLNVTVLHAFTAKLFVMIHEESASYRECPQGEQQKQDRCTLNPKSVVPLCKKLVVCFPKIASIDGEASPILRHLELTVRNELKQALTRSYEPRQRCHHQQYLHRSALNSGMSPNWHSFLLRSTFQLKKWIY